MKGLKAKLVLVTAILVLAGLFFVLGLDDSLSLANLKAQLEGLKAFYQAHQAFSITVYLLGYILMAALSLPGAAVVSLAGGAVFGLVAGVVVVSFASSLGATLAFLFSRYLFRDWVQKRFAAKIQAINEGIQRQGGFYLFTLRLVPAFPFFVINLVMGLTPISTRLFYLVSQIGMLPGTLVYVNAGTHLGQLDSVAGIYSPGLLVSFALLGLFPLVAKKGVEMLQARKIYANWPSPRSFDYNLVVVGAGSAGLVSAYIAAAVRARVALIESHKMGGDCLNTGCVPSKSLIASARFLALAARAKAFGMDRAEVYFDFSQIMARVREKVRRIQPHDSVARYTAMGVECIQGRAEILTPFEVRVNNRVLTTRSIIVATGASPLIPGIPGLDQVDYLTSDTVWDLTELPRRLVVLGAGPMGCELAQAFLRLGAEVTLIHRGSRILQKEDEDVSDLVADRFREEGMALMLAHQVREIRVRNGAQVLVCTHGDGVREIPFDKLLLALGRVPNTAGFGLERLGVALDPQARIRANGFLQTNFPNIFCCGDVHGRFQFTHTAAHEAWYASVNALFGKIKRFRASYQAIPWATFTDPEVARVGLNEAEAREKGLAYEKTIYRIDDLDRAITDSQDSGYVKVLTAPGRDAILGVTIVGHHASEMIPEFVLAMTHGIGLNKILGTIHIYPTMAEANKYAAGMWKKAHAPERLLAWVERFHAWMRN